MHLKKKKRKHFLFKFQWNWNVYPSSRDLATSIYTTYKKERKQFPFPPLVHKWSCIKKKGDLHTVEIFLLVLTFHKFLSGTSQWCQRANNQAVFVSEFFSFVTQQPPNKFVFYVACGRATKKVNAFCACGSGTDNSSFPDEKREPLCSLRRTSVWRQWRPELYP